MDIKVYTYFRYVNDIFMIIPNNKLNYVLEVFSITIDHDLHMKLKMMK